MTGLLRLEAAAVLRARVAVVSLLGAGVLVALFVALATRESSVIAFTGFERVVTGVGLAALLFVPLLALASTVQAITAARHQGVLEWYLSHPVSRAQAFWAMGLPRLVAVGGPVLAAVLGLALAALAFGDPIPPAVLGRLTGILLGQVVCFTALGLWLSVTARSAEQALVRGLALWMATAALLDFALVGAMLRWHLPAHLVFLISAVNPVQAGRLGLLAGTDPELGVLGPVGTWIATTLGPGGTSAYAVGWPLVLGLVAALAARRSFLRGDLL